METRSFLDASSAGHKPQSSAVTIARVPENVTTRQSSPQVDTDGQRERRHDRAQQLNQKHREADAHEGTGEDSTRLSVTSSRTMRARFAPSASRSETSSRPRHPAGEQHAADVRARDQQDQRDEREEQCDEQRRGCAAGRRNRPGGLDADTPAAVGVRVFALKIARNAGDLLTGLGQCHPALEPSVGHHPYRRARREHGGRIPRYIVRIDTGSAERRIRRDRYPEIGDRQVRSSESRRGDTEDCKWLAVEPHLAADDVAFAVEAAFPQSMSDHDYRSRTLEPVISGFECTAESHRHAGHVEIVGRDFGAGMPAAQIRRPSGRRLPPLGDTPPDPRTRCCDRAGPRNSDTTWCRSAGRSGCTADIDETIGRSDAWEGAEQQSVGDAEDGGVTGHADGVFICHQREGRAVEEGPESVFHGTWLLS